MNQEGTTTRWQEHFPLRQEEEDRIREERERQLKAYRRLLWLREHSMEAFMEEPEVFCFDPQGSISSQQLYGLYRGWCAERRILEQTQRSFFLFLKKNAARYNILYTMNIPTPAGGHVRGFRGIRAVPAGEQNHTLHPDAADKG